MILNDWVIDPVVVKTVSYFKLSAVMVTCASGLVIKDSFLHATRKIERDKINKPKVNFIGIKNNRRKGFLPMLYAVSHDRLPGAVAKSSYT